MHLYSQLIQAETGDVIKQSVRCNQVVTRILATWPFATERFGVDASLVFVASAREHGAELSALSFQEAGGRTLPCSSTTFDVVVFMEGGQYAVSPVSV
jgi:hypothetical protein